MSTALTEKYRPRTFAEVVGHEAQIKSLQNALKSGSANTFLFTGESGLGKTTLARIAAKALGALTQDIHEIDAATHTGVEHMRDVVHDLNYRPLGEGTIKAVIVDEAHALSKAAFQSLLKPLEEPPEWVRWFLCTTEPGRLLPTIKTRSFTVDLKPLRTLDLRTLLTDIAADEKMKLAEGVLTLCATEAKGSARQAIANLAACAVAADLEEAQELLRAAVETSEAIDLARALSRNASWSEVQALLGKLKEANPESVRHTVRAYFTSVVLGAKGNAAAGRGLEILDAFLQPFNSADGMSPLVMACGKAVFGSGS